MSAEPHSIRSLLAIPQVGRTLSSSLIARLPYTSIGLLLILRVRETGAGYSEAGAAAGAFALGLACMGPVIGRLVDRRGQRAVLLACAIACALPLIAVALTPDDTPVGVIIALAALAGMVHPPVSGATRALWPDMVPRERRHAVYAIEAAGVEVTFILGPLMLVGAFAAVTSPSLALVAATALLVAGTIIFTTAPASRRWRPSATAARSVAGALSSPVLLTLMVAVTCMGASFGAIEVAITAHADEHGHPSLVGPLLSAWALGSLVAGVAMARSRPPADPHARLVLLLAATALADGLVALAPGPLTLAPALFLAGSCIAPAFATLYAMVADVAREGTVTESYTWVTTGITAGVSAGAALGGVVIDGVSTHATIAGAAGMVALAALVTTAGRHLLVGPTPA